MIVSGVRIFTLIIFFFILSSNFLHGQYCSSSSIAASFCSTSLVSIGTLNNASSGCANYSDYSNIYTELLLGNSYLLTIGLENCSGFNTPKISNVYIDWNGNEVFESNEEVFHINATSTIMAGQTNFSTTINVPNNAAQDTIRMRVVTLWSTLDNANDYSCGTYGWGETEDYSLIIRGLINTVDVVDNNCYGDQLGQINISTFGSGSGLAYSINGGLDYFNFTNFDSLSNGLYNICVFDSSTNQSQCYANNPVIINSPDSLYANVSTTPVSCYGFSDGVLSAQAFNGQANYIYQWSNGSTVLSGNIINNVESAYYFLEVTDDNSCQFYLDSIWLDSPTELTIDSVSISSFSGYQISCNNGNDGAISLFVSGGSGNLFFNWNGFVNSNPTAQNLSAGSQNILVYDDNFCQKDTIIVLNEPQAITTSNLVLHVGCENENDGSISTLISGGVQPYSIGVFDTISYYFEANSDGIELFDSLNIGEYSLEIMDLNACIYTDSFTIDNPQITIDVDSVKCYANNDGQIVYSIDFTNDIFNLVSPPSLTNLTAGTYDFFIENDQGCFFDSIITIYQPEEIEIEEKVEIICDESELAKINIIASGGISPFSILWETGDSLFDLSYGIGTYSYDILDQNNCLNQSTIEVLPPSIPQLSYSMTEPSCRDNFDGSIDVLVSEGYPPFQYQWEDDREVSFIDSLAPKTYRLIVTDSANCQSEILEVLIPYVYNDCFYIPTAFTPNGDGINDTFEISSIFSRNPQLLSIFNLQGNLVFQSDELVWDGHYKNKKCPIGKYYYLLNYANQYTTGEILLLE